MTRVQLRLYLKPDVPLGPGKVQLLEAVREHGSIAHAARAMDMSYRSAWLLVDSMNALFTEAVVDTTHGGRGGGAAVITPFGLQVIRRYRAMERAARRAIARDLAPLERALRRSRRRRT